MSILIPAHAHLPIYAMLKTGRRNGEGVAGSDSHMLNFTMYTCREIC